MNISTTTPIQIRNSPSNTSTSKQQWSFSKANRFVSPRSTCSRSFYEHRSCLSERKSSIGIGNRSKMFDGNQNIPEPCKYNLPSDFDTKNKKKGFSFTENRDKIKFGNFVTIQQNTPTPTTYKINQSQVRLSKGACLTGKTAYPWNYFLPNKNVEQIQQKRPGPGQYNTIDCMGSNYRTKSPNHQALSFASSNRFREQKQSPGPQDYASSTIEADGIYILSNMKSSGRRSFLKGRRLSEFEGSKSKDIPGPGNYRIPSDFGHYEQPMNINMTALKEKGASRPQTAIV